MRLLVTGRQGQLAQSLLERGKQLGGAEILALGRPDIDLEVPGSVAAAIATVQPDLVINAAAYTAVDQAEDEPGRAFRINAEAAGEAAAAAREAGVPIIQLSTDYVFDGSGEGDYCEDAPTNPLGVYGHSKLEGEERVREFNPDHLILRTGWLYSPFGPNFVSTMLGLAERRPEVSIVADQWGCPTSALDLADGLLAVAEAWHAGGRAGCGQVLHFAGKGSCSWAELAAETFRVSEEIGGPSATVRAIATADYPTRAARPANSVLDCSAFERAFGFAIRDWRASLPPVVRRLVAAIDAPGNRRARNV